MPTDRLRARFAAVGTLVLCAAALRILPHPPNFTPVAAMALFAGARFDRLRWAIAIPLCAMLLSDLALEAMFGYGWHAHMPAVYASFIGCVALGMLLRHQRGIAATAAASLTGSLAFFFVTNFSVWALEAFYPHTIVGLATCYTAALPYLWPTVVGDFAYTGLFFGTFVLAEKHVAVLAPLEPRYAVMP